MFWEDIVTFSWDQSDLVPRDLVPSLVNNIMALKYIANTETFDFVLN